jgi:hypothetical protein
LPVHVRSVVIKWQLGTIFSEYFSFPLSVIMQPMLHTHLYYQIARHRQTGGACHESRCWRLTSEFISRVVNLYSYFRIWSRLHKRKSRDANHKEQLLTTGKYPKNWPTFAWPAFTLLPSWQKCVCLCKTASIEIYRSPTLAPR